MSKDINTNFKDFTSGYSIEVIPRSAAKIESFSDLLPKSTRVYIAHIETKDITAMVATAKRLKDEGFTVMPHIPARMIKNQAMLNDWISMYQNEAGVDEALLIAGGSPKPIGDYDSSIKLIESGLFDLAGFKRLHIAGHPEGNKDIDPDGEIKNVSDSDDSVVLKKNLNDLSTHIDIGHAGTAMRFLTAFLSIQNNKEFEITGSRRMKQRPIKILVDALNHLGADVVYKDKVGYPPLIIRGKKLSGKKISLSAEISSQYISALILIAPILETGLSIHLEGSIASKPYLEMTLSILSKIGVNYEFNNNTINIEYLSEIDKTTINVESDWSSASYFYSIVALSNKSELNIGSFYNSSMQGDKELSNIYSKFGGVYFLFLPLPGQCRHLPCLLVLSTTRALYMWPFSHCHQA